jgi:hypothetical protein
MAFDPFELNKKLFEQWEKTVGEFLEKRMRDPAFMDVMGKSMALSLDVKRALDARMTDWLKSMSVPTKDDLEGLWRKLNELETRLVDLEHKVDEIASRSAAGASRRAKVGPKGRAGVSSKGS